MKGEELHIRRQDAVPTAAPFDPISDAGLSIQFERKILTYAKKTKISSHATFGAARNFETRRRMIATPASTVKKIKGSCQWRLESGEMPHRVEVTFSEADRDVSGQHEYDVMGARTTPQPLGY